MIVPPLPRCEHPRTSLGILITYHGERELLTECLDSILNQLRPEDEVLVYDDASPNSPAVDYVRPDARVEVVRSEVNRGPACGRNALLRRSLSTYVHFHDADDLFHPEWAGRVRGVFEEKDVDAVFTEVSSHRGAGMMTARVMDLERVAAGEDLVRFCIRGAILAPAGTYRKAAVLAVGGYREALWQSEDYDFHIRLAASGIRYEVLSEALVQLRVRPEGRSQHRGEVWASALDAIRLLSEELPVTYHLELAEAAARAGSILFRLGAKTEARGAFALARILGPAQFSREVKPYRVLAQILGPEAAENVGWLYRKLPEPLRERIRGWSR